MKTVSVNLLPSEIILQRKQGIKLILFNRLSIVLLVVMLFFTSALFSLRISQKMELKKVGDNLAYAENQVSSVEGKEKQLIILKLRLNSIKSTLGSDLKRKSIFNTVIALTPENMKISEVSVDKNGNMLLVVSTSSLVALEELVSNLSNKEKNSDLISKLTLNGLSRGKDNIYRLNLKVVPK